MAVIALACARCREEFLWDLEQTGSQKIYCSRQCKERAHQGRRLRAKRQRARSERRCRYCGVDISTRDGPAKYCSAQCRMADHRTLPLPIPRKCASCDTIITTRKYCVSCRIAQRPGRYAPPPERHCHVCGTVLPTTRRKYCSKACGRTEENRIFRERGLWRYNDRSSQKYKDAQNARTSRRYAAQQGAYLALRDLLPPEPALPRPSLKLGKPLHIVAVTMNYNNFDYWTGQLPHCVICNLLITIGLEYCPACISKLWPQLYCQICGTQLSEGRRRKYCSDACKRKHNVERSRRLYVRRKAAYLVIQKLAKEGAVGLIKDVTDK